MPYSSTSDLPASVRDKYSDKCQRAYMHAFNSVHDDTGDEGRAAAAGHSAAQDCEGKKNMDTLQADIMPATKFQIFSGLLKTSRSSDGKMRLHGVASSTTRDLHGDTMLATALEDMERAANQNLTIFLNHSYEVPEDVAGSVEKAQMKTRGVDADGNPNYDLDMDILVNDANERAVKAFEAIERGTKLGLSIGALIPEGGATKDSKTKAWMIEHIDLLETSLVGIPANPRSWVDYAVKSLKGIESGMALGTPTLTLDGNNYTINGTITQGAVTISDTLVVDVEDDVEPEVTDAQVTIIQIDTGDGSSESDPGAADTASQGTDSSDPGNGDGDFAASEEADLVQVLPVVMARYQSAIDDLIAAKELITALQGEVKTISGERDAAKTGASQLYVETQRVLSSLADAPFARRTVLPDAQASLSERFGGIYGESLLKHLEK